MKKNSYKLLRWILCISLALTLALPHSAAVFAAEEGMTDQGCEGGAVTEMNIEEKRQAADFEETAEPGEAEEGSEEPGCDSGTETGTNTEEEPQAVPSAEPAGQTDKETAESVPEESFVSEETSESVPEESAASEETSGPVSEETQEALPGEAQEAGSEQASNTEEAAAEAEDISGETEIPEQSIGNAAAKAAGTIHIGDTTFSSGEDESSHWSEGKGWKNLAGQYVAMVDYKGQETEISMDGGVLTLAVAGVNRIGTLKGDCSVNIVGTGIVLIDSIELEEGNYLSLMTNTALYEEGSAAVFLKQGNGDYLLINGGITGILDEDYVLDGVKLIIPEGSSLTLTAAGIRTETWYPDGSSEPVTEITRYTSVVPYGVDTPIHENGEAHLERIASRVTLGKNSTLTVNNGASVLLKDVIAENLLNDDYVSPNLIIQGVLNVLGVVEGGILDILDGGSLLGEKTGTVLSSEINLEPAGDLSKELLLEDSTITVYGGGNGRSVSAKIKDSIISLNGSHVFVQDLDVSGKSMLSYGASGSTMFSVGGEIGNITLQPESSLDILMNDHNIWESGQEGWEHWPIRLLEDGSLKISGKITGGKVFVRAGAVEYTGKQTDILPVVPSWNAARVLIDGIETGFSEFPLIMTKEEASARAESDKIPVMRLSVEDGWISDEISLHEWEVTSYESLEDLVREKDQNFTCASFLDAYDLEGHSGEQIQWGLDFKRCWTAVEVIYSDLSRMLYWLNDQGASFSTENVIMIRVLDCTPRGGMGGTALSSTETTYTGSGVLGGPGNGSVTTSGKGSAVYPEYKPYSDDPEEKEDDPKEKEDDPKEKEDDPEEKEDDPKEKEDKPDEKDDNSGKNKNRANRPSTVRETTDNDFTAVITEEGNGRYTLTVYKNGTELNSLDGSSVTVRVQAPEEITQDDICYIVFEDNGQSKWIPAKYDEETRELIFETDRAGTFGIARVSVENAKYREANADTPDKPIVRKMSIRIGEEEITDLPDPIKVEVLLEKDENSGEGFYAVFVDEKEKLDVFPVICDESNKNKKKYQFETDVTGYFVVVKPDKTFKSDSELEDACKAKEEVQTLVTLLRQDAFEN